MRYSFALLALAGASLAVPTRIARQAQNVKVVNDVEYDTVVDVVTDVVTVNGPSPTPAPAPAPAPAPVNKQQAAPQPKEQVVTVPAAPPAPASTQAAQAPAPTQQAAAPSSSGLICNKPPSGNDLLDTANKWRCAYGLQPFNWDDQLAKNAKKTGTDDGGSQENHELNPGSYAQVITPGNDDKPLLGLTSFEVAYVGGWLCEEPVDALHNICPDLDKAAGLDVSGDTDHAKILRNTDYKTIGCAFASNGGNGPWKGLWVCDLA